MAQFSSKHNKRFKVYVIIQIAIKDQIRPCKYKYTKCFKNTFSA